VDRLRSLHDKGYNRWPPHINLVYPFVSADCLPGAVDAIRDADVVVLPPSNPVVSVGTILGVPGVREALASTEARVVGLSPIVGDTHVHGMAAQMLTSIGVEVTAAAVGRHYGARADGGVIDGWLVDERDAHHVAAVEEAGIACAAVPLMMTDHDATADMAAAALDLVGPSPVSGQ
jgi:LPPG:FO 2-phospho-L-lactate transferase